MNILRLIAITIFLMISPNISFIHAESEKSSTMVSAEKNKSLVFIVANGYRWNTLSAQSKLLYLTGLQDGISLLTLRFVDSKRSIVKTSMEAVVESYFLQPLDIDNNKFVSIIDSVYDNVRNREIPIIDIYLLLIEEKKNENQNNLSKLLSELRQKYLND
jgi:hypothetical protein